MKNVIGEMVENGQNQPKCLYLILIYNDYVVKNNPRSISLST